MIIIEILVGLISVILMITFIETLIWWFLWSKNSNLAFIPQGNWKNALIFLTGISDYTRLELESEQIKLLQNISQQFNVDLVIQEPFPYEKFTAKKMKKLGIWRYLGFKDLPLWLISLHNFWQALLVIVLEENYGKTIANCLINRLKISASSEGTLWLICGSIGANLALAAAKQLKKELSVRLIIIAYGGFFRGSMGFNYTDRFYHLIGHKDNWQKLSNLIFPKRYLPIGALAKAKKEQRFTIYYTGEHKHLDYLSDRLCLAEGKTYGEMTLTVLTNLSIWQEMLYNKQEN